MTDSNGILLNGAGRESARPRVAIPGRVEPGERVAAAFVSLVAIAVLGLATWLTPDPSGHGTHKQLGLTPCVWTVTMNRPCPTCGMTTAFSNAAHGDFVSSFRAQPLGMVLSIVTAMAFWVGLYVAVTGSTAGRLILGMMGSRFAWLAVGALLAAWVYKLATWQGA